MSDRLLKESDVIREVESLLVSDEMKYLNDLEYGNNQALCHVIDRIEDLPSADRPSATEIMNAYHEGVRKGIAEAYEAYGADRPQGHYIKGENGEWYCSECKRIDDKYSVANFCWYCGAKMDGEREGE